LSTFWLKMPAPIRVLIIFNIHEPFSPCFLHYLVKEQKRHKNLRRPHNHINTFEGTP
jgi:hypothetical protein